MRDWLIAGGNGLASVVVVDKGQVRGRLSRGPPARRGNDLAVYVSAFLFCPVLRGGLVAAITFWQDDAPAAVMFLEKSATSLVLSPCLTPSRVEILKKQF